MTEDEFEPIDCTTADQARDHAINWSHWMNDQNLSWGEMADWAHHFEELVERFPELADEFKENGII